MKTIFNSLLSYFLTPAGVLVTGALDASLVFFLPLGIDFVVIIMAARKPEMFWLYGLLATIGSLLGAGATFWIGRKVGEHGLARLIKPSTLKRVERRVAHSAAIPIAALGVMDSRTFTIAVVALAVLAVVGTIASAVAVYRSVKRRSAATPP